MGGLLHCRSPALLELRQQRIEVVVGFAGFEQVVAGGTLHHPQVSPPRRESRCGLTATEGFLHAKQFSQNLLCHGAIQRLAAGFS